jgi:hypothetical protein
MMNAAMERAAALFRFLCKLRFIPPSVPRTLENVKVTHINKRASREVAVITSISSIPKGVIELAQQF